MEHILRNTLLTLIEVPGSTLLSVSRMLGDARFREGILTKVNDPVVRSFWLREFASMPPKLQAKHLKAIGELQKLFGPDYRPVRVWSTEGADGWC